jgi:hypothetical protein
LVEWREILTGTILAVVLIILFGLLFGTNGTYIGILIAGFITGIISGNRMVDWPINGGCVGLFTGIILVFTAFILTLFYGASAGFGAGILGGTISIGAQLYLILSYVIISILTTVAGAIISKKLIN